MPPVLQLGPITVQTYPLALVVAAWVALAVGAWTARRTGLDGDHIYNAGLYGLIAGVVAGRLGHVVAYWPAYRSQLIEIVGINTGAFLLWPALLAGAAAIALYVHRRRLPWRRMLDALAPGVLVGVAIAAIGALLAGRMLGAPSGVPWAVHLWGVARHPSQVYEGVAALVTAGLTLRMVSRGSREGTAALVAIMGYGLSRWLLEPFRAESQTILGGLRTAQVLGLAGALLAAWLLLRITSGWHERQFTHEASDRGGPTPAGQDQGGAIGSSAR